LLKGQLKIEADGLC